MVAGSSLIIKETGDRADGLIENADVVVKVAAAAIRPKNVV
jgi:hypothetical protein